MNQNEYYRQEEENELRRQRQDPHGDIYTEDDFKAWAKRKKEMEEQNESRRNG